MILFAKETRRNLRFIASEMRKSVPKMSLMITSAIRHLRQAHGSTSKEIMNYITSRYDSLEPDIQRQMSAALKRCLEYGIANKTRGRYKLNSLEECIARAGVGPIERPGRRRRSRKLGGNAGKGKGRGVRRRRAERARGSPDGGNVATCGERCRCATTRGRNAYASGSDIPGEGSQEREEEKEKEEQERRRHEDSEKDVVCCFENKWREGCGSGSNSTDRSRSTLDGNLEPNDDDNINDSNNNNKGNT